MFIGETPQITFKLDQAFGLDLNDAQQIEVKLTNNGRAVKTYLKSAASPDDVKVDGTGLIVHVNLQRVDSLTLKPGQLLIQLNIKMPVLLYPEFPSDGFYSIVQTTEPVLKSI